jgi:hypothetical protein
MRVNLRGGQVHVPEQGLDVHELGAGLQEPGRVGMPKLMRRDLLVDASPLDEPPGDSPVPAWEPGALPLGSLANTNSSFPLSFSQNPDTCSNSFGNGTNRSWLPLLQLHS